MSKSTHQIAVKAQDQTAGAFASIQTRAAAASAKLRSMLGGAMAAAGAYFGFRSIAGAINELGTLSDIAQKSSLSVEELTKSATALNILGIQNMGVEQIAKAFQTMEKNTGRSGMEGFYQTIGELGKIPNVSDRATAAMSVFGRSGMELMPLINAANKGTEALRGVIGVMPGIPQAAADACDDAADAMTYMSGTFKKIWKQGIATIVGWFGKNYTGGIRQAAMEASNYMILYAKISVQTAMEYYRKFTGFFEKVCGWVGTFVGTKMAGGSWGDAFKAANEDWRETAKAQDIVEAEIEKRDKERRERWGQEFEEQRVEIAKFARNLKNSAKGWKLPPGDGDGSGGGDLFGGDIGKKITNELILGGSARSLNLAMMGPQMSNELKKSNDYLRKIVDNTKKTEENTREPADVEKVGVLGV